MQQESIVVKKVCHSRKFLSGIPTSFNNTQGGDPRQKPSGMTPYVITARGFTLIELLVVVLIIGILAAVALPQYQRAVVKSEYAKLVALTSAIAQAEEVHYLATGSYAPSTEELDVELPAPTSTETDPNNTWTVYYYDWGRCEVYGNQAEYGDRVNCRHTKAQIGSEIYFSHTTHSYKNKRKCVARNADLSSVQNKLCQAETKQESGISGGTYYSYLYQ